MPKGQLTWIVAILGLATKIDATEAINRCPNKIASRHKANYATRKPVRATLAEKKHS